MQQKIQRLKDKYKKPEKVERTFFQPPLRRRVENQSITKILNFEQDHKAYLPKYRLSSEDSKVHSIKYRLSSEEDNKVHSPKYRSKSRETIRLTIQNFDTQRRAISATHGDVKERWTRNSDSVLAGNYLKELEEQTTDSRCMKDHRRLACL